MVGSREMFFQLDSAIEVAPTPRDVSLEIARLAAASRQNIPGQSGGNAKRSDGTGVYRYQGAEGQTFFKLSPGKGVSDEILTQAISAVSARQGVNFTQIPSLPKGFSLDIGNAASF